MARKEVSIAFKRDIRKVGSSMGIAIPREILEVMGATPYEKYPVVLKVFEGKHGKFIAIWADEEKLQKLEKGETAQSEEE